MDDRTGNAAPDAQANTRNDKSSHECTDYPDDDVAKQAVAVAFDDQSCEPASHCADQKHNEQTFQSHFGTFPLRMKLSENSDLSYRSIAAACNFDSAVQAHGATVDGGVVFRKKLARGKVLEFLSKQPVCVVALEACASAHHRGREIAALGHDVRLIPPIYVKPFVKRQKNDAADAEAIAEVSSRLRSNQTIRGIV